MIIEDYYTCIDLMRIDKCFIIALVLLSENKKKSLKRFHISYTRKSVGYMFDLNSSTV